MKRYKDYMDSLEVSDTLHEKLKNLEEPKKKPRPWKGLASMAAVMALIVGVGVGTALWSNGGWLADNPVLWVEIIDHFRPAAEIAPEIADIPTPDIASEDPGYVAEPGTKTNGGYEVVHGDKNDPNTMVSYYVLPWLDWADASACSQSALNYVLAPPGAIQRAAAWDDVQIFAGGEKAMADHLLWDGLDWNGELWFLEDGAPCAAALSAYGEGLDFFLEIRKGHEVPSCIVLPAEYYETSQWQGVEITALKNGGYMVDDDGVTLAEKREVNFFCNGTGYKLTLYARDAERADELCARFVRYAVAGGFHLYALSYEPAYDEDLPSEPIPAVPDGVPDEESGSFSCPYCADGTAHTHPYDPNVPTEAKSPIPPN